MKARFDMSLIWARVSLFIMEFLIFGKPYSDNTTDIDKTNKQNNNVYFQNLLSINSKFKTCSYENITIIINYKK